MRRRPTVVAIVVFAAFLAAAAPAAAGIHYQAETTTAPAQGKAQVTRVEAWVDGPNAKVVFRESDQPVFSEGAYLLTQDGGKTLFLVDPEEETITEWDLAAMLGMVGGVMEGMQGIMNLEFSDVAVEKLGEESGGELLGYPVTHAKYRTTYTTSIKVLGMQRGSSTETVQELWTTDAFGDPALGVWLRSEPPATDMEELDALIAAGEGRGLPAQARERLDHHRPEGQARELEPDRDGGHPARGDRGPRGHLRAPGGLHASLDDSGRVLRT